MFATIILLELQSLFACHVRFSYNFSYFSNFFITAIVGPDCVPSCGKSAHCEYSGTSTKCVCNSGTSGNPYEVCSSIERKTCQSTSCGTNAQCKETYNDIQCGCQNGFTGNPFIECQDIDECSNNVCGQSAVCINTIGSYDCRCKEGYAGNPFVMCSQVQGGICKNSNNCKCNERVLCPAGYSCTRGQCKNLCESVKCGTKAECVDGQCVCSLGYIGDPAVGCKTEGVCHSDIDCNDSEICFQLGKGLRKCVDACSKIQCGPNALCLSANHRSSCICAPGYLGNPSDLSLGCQPEERVFHRECEHDKDCRSGTVCSIEQRCVSPCETVACGLNELCKLDVNGHATCVCREDHIWNPISSACEKPSVPDCNSDSECQPIASCQPDELNILKCVPVCSQFTCPLNAACVAESHKGQCQCLAGFTGNPKDRNGCRLLTQDQCTSDGQCSEHEVCKKIGESRLCKSACDTTTCGLNAICVVNNHVAQCQCPPGTYIQDPTTFGCKAVPCVYNIDCPSSQLCNRMTHTCFDVCDEESCGTNAVCIAENQKATCQCPPGFAPNPIPEVECITVEVCKPNPCHASAICQPSNFGHTCKCPPNTIGDPFTAGCRPEGACPNGDRDCPKQSICIEQRCINPCEQQQCGPNAICQVQNRKAVCTCPLKFTEGPNGCVRIATNCSLDADCGGEVCFQEQCRSVCRDSNDCSSGENCIEKKCMVPCSDHSQCFSNQACLNGMCLLGCRTNKNCLSHEACINNKCTNPCNLQNPCGPNAICTLLNQKVVCSCPLSFEGNPTPVDGCIRIPAICQTANTCPTDHTCFKNQCTLKCQDNSNCAVGERCSNNICMKVCYNDNNCLPGEVCLQGVCQPGCAVDADCRTSQVCVKGQCRCTHGFIGTPQGCTDINECEDNPCHPSAHCQNLPGSYRCLCPEGTVGDPFLEPGCLLPNQCHRSTDCADNLVCKSGKCQDPCEEVKCGPNAACNVFNHKLVCSCPTNHLGDPSDLKIGCFKVECLTNKDCAADRQCDARSNKCLSKFLNLF